jgi:lysophospholipase L1-like esterase
VIISLSRLHRRKARILGVNHMAGHVGRGWDRFKLGRTASFLFIACCVGLVGCSAGTETETIEPDDPNQGAPAQYRILAFGDSITVGNGATTEGEGYPYYLEELLSVEHGPTVIINAGKGGESTSEGLVRLEPTIRKWNGLQTLLLLEGAKDVMDSSGAGPPDAIAGNLREMIRLARDDYGLEVVLGTLLPRVDYEKDQESPTTSELVAAIRDLAEEEDVLLADHYQYFLGMEEWEELFKDAVHPNDQGYQVLADSWYEGALRYLFP